MKLVFLDTKTIGEDIDLSAYDALGEVVKYGFSTLEEIPERVKDADVLIVNKIAINEQTIGNAKNLKLVCVTATGTNNLDKEYLKKRGIAWRNVAGYSTESVTQHTFALLFYLLEKIRYYDDYVKDEKYINDTVFTHFAEHFNEVNGKTWGIIGLGTIGRRVADIAKAFGARVIYYSASGSEETRVVTFHTGSEYKIQGDKNNGKKENYCRKLENEQNSKRDTTDPKPTGTAEFQFILQAGKTASAKLYFSCIGIKHCTENQR